MGQSKIKGQKLPLGLPYEYRGTSTSAITSYLPSSVLETAIRARRSGAVVKVLTLHAQDPIWVPVLIPAAPLPFQLPACGPGKQSRTAQGFGTLHLHGRPGRGSWLQIDIASAIAAHLGSESLDGRSSSLSLLSVYPPFQ